jgi:hypothetical protein
VRGSVPVLTYFPMATENIEVGAPDRPDTAHSVQSDMSQVGGRLARYLKASSLVSLFRTAKDNVWEDSVSSKDTAEYKRGEDDPSPFQKLHVRRRKSIPRRPCKHQN